MDGLPVRRNSKQKLLQRLRPHRPRAARSRSRPDDRSATFAAHGDPDREARYWLKRLEEADGKRSRFQHAYGEGVLSLEDLKARLAEIEELEVMARRELRNLKGMQDRIAELERDRDALLEYYAGSSPEARDS